MVRPKIPKNVTATVCLGKLIGNSGIRRASGTCNEQILRWDCTSSVLKCSGYNLSLIEYRNLQP
jgi:hypothetical protein